MKRLSAIVCASLLVAAWAAGRQEPPATGEGLLLVNANIVNPADGRVTPRAAVLVRNGRFASIETNVPSNAVETIDLAGAYLVPGLVDAHAHVSTLLALRTALASGVTTLRSSGVSSFVDAGMRELVRRGALDGPEVIASGYHVRPRPADEAFLDFPELSVHMRRGVSGADAVRQLVRANLSRRVDWIKVMATERAGTADTDPRQQVYGEPELKAAVEEAAAKGVPVQAHAHGDQGATAAVRAGVRSIEHGTYLSDATLRLMAENGTYLVPTLATVVDLAEPGGDYDSAALRLRGRHMLPRLRETVQRAHRMGVRIVTGADTSYGQASVTRISHEVAALVELGFTPAEALRAATVTAAEMLKMGDRVGAIAPGFEADAIAVERNPLEDPRALDDVLLVISNGRIAVRRKSKD